MKCYPNANVYNKTRCIQISLFDIYCEWSDSNASPRGCVTTPIPSS